MPNDSDPDQIESLYSDDLGTHAFKTRRGTFPPHEKLAFLEVALLGYGLFQVVAFLQ
jgi:hypothetical protein